MAETRDFTDVIRGWMAKDAALAAEINAIEREIEAERLAAWLEDDPGEI